MKRLKENVRKIDLKGRERKKKLGKAKELCTEETEGFTLDILSIEECCQNWKSTENFHSLETSVKVRTNLSKNDTVTF